MCLTLGACNIKYPNFFILDFIPLPSILQFVAIVLSAVSSSLI